MRKSLDKLFTGAVLTCLVSSAYLSYYLRPWRWLIFNRAMRVPPDNPYAQIPLPEAAAEDTAKKAEKAIA